MSLTKIKYYPPPVVICCDNSIGVELKPVRITTRHVRSRLKKTITRHICKFLIMITSSLSPTTENQRPTTISIILSQKGKPMVELNKYLFKLNRVAKIKKYWICTFNGCPAKVHTDIHNDFIRQINEHCHPAGEEKSIREFREKVKARAVQETTPIPRIYDEECEKVTMSLATISLLPSEREISKQIFSFKKYFNR